MATTSPNLGLTLAESGDVVDVDTHVAGNFSTLDSKWSTPGAPAAVEVGSLGSPGSSTVIARSDHIHGIATGTPVSTGTANSAGAATTVSASDHVHKTGDNSVATATLQDDSVTEAKLDIIDSPANDEVLTYDSGTGKMEWQTVAAITTATPLAAASLATDSVTEAKLDAIDSPNNDEVVTYDSATGRLEWQTVAALTTATPLAAASLASDSVTEAKLDCIDSPANDEVLTYDSATGRLEWQSASALVTVGATVPSGLIAAFATAAAIASGWARYTAADGRMLVGAGTTFTVTWVENTDYGSSWGHTHSDTGHGHGMGAADDTETAASGGGEVVAADGHEHSVSSGTANISTTSWVIPSRAVVWAQKS